MGFFCLLVDGRFVSAAAPTAVFLHNIIPMASLNETRLHHTGCFISSHTNTNRKTIPGIYAAATSLWHHEKKTGHCHENLHPLSTLLPGPAGE